MSSRLVVALLCAACEPRYAPGNEPALDVELPGRVVEAGQGLPISLEVRNFDLQPRTPSRPFVLGQGHLHTFAGDFCEECDLKVSTIGGQAVLFPLELAAGAHKLVFRLHHNDDSPVDGVPDRVFDVDVLEPELVFLVQRADVAGGQGTAELTVAGFQLDLAGYESQDVLRHGHFHVRFVQGDVDTDLGPFFDGKPTFVVSGAVAGPAILRFVLHTNTHDEVRSVDAPVVVR